MELLSVKGLKKYFPVKKKLAGEPLWLKAVDGIDFSIEKDKVFALVGESGCGKSTVARLVLKLMKHTGGEILFEGRDIFALKGDSLKAFRKSVQIIFQDPFASLNPRRTVFDTLSEPLQIHKIVDKKHFRDASAELLKKVGLGADIMNRYPHEFSGGQRQRICIARALAVNPKLIVADEPLSALDVSIQAQILNLLQKLREETKITFLFISHDLKIVHYFSDTVAVMYLGKIVEYAKTEELFNKPMHPYTDILLASAPRIAHSLSSASRPRRPIHPLAHSPKEIGEVPSPIHIPSGCPFHPRCPKRFKPCDKIVPELKEAKGRLVSCHLWNPYE
ncbi:MAG: ATP-binding cassette domain-containing protein [Thermodesulfovibrionales bacterium]|nr:ATP-binding cassette domain-containing protein [Thermodesulfovibrionales bacterium]